MTTPEGLPTLALYGPKVNFSEIGRWAIRWELDRPFVSFNRQSVSAVNSFQRVADKLLISKNRFHSH